MHSDDTTVRIPLRARDGSVRAYALIDAADLELVQRWRWHLNSEGYAGACVWSLAQKPQSIKLHRLLLGLEAGDKRQGDHIDRNRLNCRRNNLRILTIGENTQNRSSQPSATSRHRGVYWHKTKQRWIVQVSVGGRKWNIGRFVNEDEAAAAARSARLRLMPFATD